MGMPLHLSGNEIAFRLLLTVIAGLLIGYDRSEHGKAAGMRTTVLVCLAASVAMIQVNLLLPMAGKPSDSFITNDLMRLPLGILTGVGFIGAGAILRRDNIVVGVTTAATLWLVTVVGLCLGGGQLVLGIVTAVLGVAALQGLRWIESRLRQQIRTQLSVMIADNGLTENTLRQRLTDAGLTITGTKLILNRSAGYREFVFDLQQERRAHDTTTPPVVANLADEAGVMKLRWVALR